MMTVRERWLAAIQLQPVDRLPFWPKLGGNYPAAQATPFREQRVDEIHRWIGSDRHNFVAAPFRETYRQGGKEVVREGSLRRSIFHTPHGDREMVEQYDDPSGAWHPIRSPVETIEHVRWLTDFYANASAEPNFEAIQEVRDQCQRVGDDAILATGTWESPLMYFVEHLAGIEGAHALLADHPGEVEGLFAAMHRLLLRIIEVTAAHTPADLIYLTENTSTTLISPAQYRRYCVPCIAEYGRLTRAAGKPLVLHMCGHLKALLPELSSLPVEAFEAFTAPTLGNTTLLDGRTGCPDKCLVGGTHAMLWLKPAEQIIAQVQRDLDALPHHRGIVVTSAGVMPPICAPATIRQVGEWVRAYRLRQ
jgi:uroporphyrinogen-III decarboxylase